MMIILKWTNTITPMMNYICKQVPSSIENTNDYCCYVFFKLVQCVLSLDNKIEGSSLSRPEIEKPTENFT